MRAAPPKARERSRKRQPERQRVYENKPEVRVRIHDRMNQRRAILRITEDGGA
jgi:hypothetical protein